MDNIIANAYNNAFAFSALALLAILIWRVFYIYKTTAAEVWRLQTKFWRTGEAILDDHGILTAFQLALIMIFTAISIRIGWWSIATALHPASATYPAWAVDYRAVLLPTGILFAIGCIQAVGVVSYLVQRIRFYLLALVLTASTCAALYWAA